VCLSSINTNLKKKYLPSNHQSSKRPWEARAQLSAWQRPNLHYDLSSCSPLQVCEYQHTKPSTRSGSDLEVEDLSPLCWPSSASLDCDLKEAQINSERSGHTKRWPLPRHGNGRGRWVAGCRRAPGARGRRSRGLDAGDAVRWRGLSPRALCTSFGKEEGTFPGTLSLPTTRVRRGRSLPRSWFPAIKQAGSTKLNWLRGTTLQDLTALKN